MSEPYDEDSEEFVPDPNAGPSTGPAPKPSAAPGARQRLAARAKSRPKARGSAAASVPTPPDGPPPEHLRDQRQVRSPSRRPPRGSRSRSRAPPHGRVRAGASDFQAAYAVGPHRAHYRKGEYYSKGESKGGKDASKGGKPGGDKGESKGGKDESKGGPPRGKIGLKGDKLGGKGGEVSSRRGGWFNRCQQLCEAILAMDDAESMRLAEAFYAGQAEVWVGTDYVWTDDP